MSDMYEADFALRAPSFDRLDESAAYRIFATGAHSVPVTLQRLPEASLLWLNRRVMADDPAFHALGGDIAAYGAHLVKACGYATPDDTPTSSTAAEDTVVAYADRYGGEGIGRNGGSGRAALVNGYTVKGMGRTPLIADETDHMHASGGAYLEEAVRETIFAEIIAAEFPHSAVPTLAIIDTGIEQIWQTDRGPVREKRILLVRPCFIRPAHFERAHLYHSSSPKGGALDSMRVQHMFDQCAELFGTERLSEQCGKFFVHWAQQLAYGYVHRILPGGNSSSNICFDGKLLDFGACTALPSLAQVEMMPGAPPSGSELQTLLPSIQSLCYFYGRYFRNEMAQQPYFLQIVQQTWAAYARTVSVEMLRLCGLPRKLVEDAIANDPDQRIPGIVRKTLAHYQREKVDIVDFTPSLKVAWDLAEVWAETPPLHLTKLRGLLDELAKDLPPDVVAQRCRFMTRTRSKLYREEFKFKLFADVERSPLPGETESEAISRLICSNVAVSRRDISLDAEEDTPFGFAMSENFSLALYRCTRSGEALAVIEWEAPSYFASLGANPAEVSSEHRRDALALHGWGSDNIVLGRIAQIRLPCFVSTT